MGLAGCFQTAGDPAGGVGVAGVSTFTPVANDVVPPMVSLTPSEEIVLSEAETATPEGEVALLITATPLQPEPTEELLLFVTATPTQQFIFEDTPTPPDQAASVGDEPEQDIISDAQLTATAIFDRATQSYWETQTATAQVFFPTPTSEGGGGGVFFPTATPPVQIQPPVLPPVVGGSCQHTVVTGDNLFRIALRYGSTVEAIAAANGITNVSLIRVGQVLTIPNCTGGGQIPPPGGGVGQPYTVRTGDTLFRIALTYNTTVEAIAANNPAITNINLIFIGQVIYIP
jgi:LysM repeat protein